MQLQYYSACGNNPNLEYWKDFMDSSDIVLMVFAFIVLWLATEFNGGGGGGTRDRVQALVRL